jgi:hypothetical protein
MNSFGVPWADGSPGKAKCPYQNRWYDLMICEGQAGRMAGFPLAGEQPYRSR